MCVCFDSSSCTVGGKNLMLVVVKQLGTEHAIGGAAFFSLYVDNMLYLSTNLLHSERSFHAVFVWVDHKFLNLTVNLRILYCIKTSLYTRNLLFRG